MPDANERNAAAPDAAPRALSTPASRAPSHDVDPNQICRADVASTPATGDAHTLPAPPVGFETRSALGAVEADLRGLALNAGGESAITPPIRLRDSVVAKAIDAQTIFVHWALSAESLGRVLTATDAGSAPPELTLRCYVLDQTRADQREYLDHHVSRWIGRCHLQMPRPGGRFVVALGVITGGTFTHVLRSRPVRLARPATREVPVPAPARTKAQTSVCAVRSTDSGADEPLHPPYRVALVVRQHLPFVGRSRPGDRSPDRWLYDMLRTAYLPLLETFRALEKDDVPVRLTLGISPTLAAMLGDQALMERFRGDLHARRTRVGQRLRPTLTDRSIGDLGLQDRQARDLASLDRLISFFEDTLQGDVLAEYKRLWREGRLELITSTATGATLPLLESRAAMDAQVAVAVEDFERTFGHRPQGMWLPGEVFCLGCDELLARHGIRYFMVDRSALLHGSPRPPHDAVTAVVCPTTGVVAFAIDPPTASAASGSDDDRVIEPGAGSETALLPIAPHFDISAVSDHGASEPNFEDLEQDNPPTEPQAERWLSRAQARLAQITGGDEIPPSSVAVISADPLPHGGPDTAHFVDALLRTAKEGRTELSLVTPTEYLDAQPSLPTCEPDFQSALPADGLRPWCNSDNDWLYRRLDEAEWQMVELARVSVDPDPRMRRALNQAARELLLAQSGDWALMMTHGIAVEYAIARVNGHLAAFGRIRRSLVHPDSHGVVADAAYLEAREKQWNLFPGLDYRVFRPSGSL